VIFNIEQCIDSGKIESLRDRIWASAKRDYLRGEQWFLDEAETQINNDRNRGLYAEDPWLEKISSHLTFRTSGDFIISSDLLTHVLEVPIERQTQRELMRINRILTACGYYKSRKKVGGTFKHIWRRCGTDE
jgi:predicted P-loop ATPase